MEHPRLARLDRSVRDLGGACGLGGTLTAHGGPFAFGNGDFRLELTGANNGTPTAATMLVKFGNNPGFFRCGPGCALLIQDFDVGFGVSGNATTFPLPVTCDPNVFDLTLIMQAFVLTPSVNPCGLAPTSVSNAMSLTIRD